MQKRTQIVLGSKLRIQKIALFLSSKLIHTEPLPVWNKTRPVVCLINVTSCVQVFQHSPLPSWQSWTGVGVWSPRWCWTESSGRSARRPAGADGLGGWWVCVWASPRVQQETKKCLLSKANISRYMYAHRHTNVQVTSKYIMSFKRAVLLLFYLGLS